jgi:hypothetical protein
MNIDTDFTDFKTLLDEKNGELSPPITLKELRKIYFDFDFVNVQNNQNEQKKRRPSSPNIFGQNTLLFFKITRKFNVYAIYLYDHKILVECDILGNVINYEKTYNTFNELCVSKIREKYPERCHNINIYEHLYYFDFKQNLYISLKNVSEGDMFNMYVSEDIILNKNHPAEIPCEE